MRQTSLARFVPIVLVAALAACAEDSIHLAPTALTVPAAGARSIVSAITCTANVATHSLGCGGGATGGGALADVIIGGQSSYVTLASSNLQVSSADCPDAQVPDITKFCFSFDATVQNLTPQPLGTADTSAAHAANGDGVRVFFQSGPTSTGSGTLDVANPDGTGSFTASSQPYYQYNTVLSTDSTSSAKHWELQFSPDVTSFTFTAYVSTAVPYPDGYIDGLARVLTLNPNETFTLPGTARSVAGSVSSDPIVFTSNNTSLATISGNQITAGSTNGSTTITALSGVRPGTMPTWIAVCPSTVVTDGTSLPDSITTSDCYTAIHLGDNYLPGHTWVGNLYRVTLAAGDSIEITMDVGDSGWGSPFFFGVNGSLVFSDRLGNILGQNNDDPDHLLGDGARIRYTATTAGVYIIQATTYAPGDTGHYTLGVTITPRC